MSTFIDGEDKVLSFMEQVQMDIDAADQEEKFLDSTDYKLRKLDDCRHNGVEICLDSILRAMYKDAIPLNDDYKTAYQDDIDSHFDTFIQKKCPKGIEFYVKEGLRKNSPFAHKVIAAVESLVEDETRNMGMNIENIDQKDLVFACDDDVTAKLNIIGNDLNVPEISQAVQNNVRATAISEINRAKMAKEELKQLENSLANDVNVNTPAAVESALEFQDKNQPKDYVPTLFEAVMINKVNELTAKYENAEFDKVYLYGALDEYRTEKQEDGIKFASLDELAFIEAVKEYTALSMLKALKFESFNKYEIQDMAQTYAESTVISK